jgi:hypothetical protein
MKIDIFSHIMPGKYLETCTRVRLFDMKEGRRWLKRNTANLY